MTIEEQMYDEIMHKMPHRIAELVKTIDTIHKMLEAKGYGKLNDNLDQLKKALEQAEQEYDRIYKTFYINNDFENLLPTSYPEMVNDFTDSEYLDETFDSVSDYYTSGENGDWCVEQILEDYEPADDPSLDITDNYNYIAQNEDFKTLCEYYYNDEYDIEEEGTFKDNYIDENGNFDFEKFCENTDFKDDIMHDMDKAILKDDKVYQRMDEIRQSYKEDEQKYYDEKYEDYTTEELEAEMDELRKAPIYANSGHDEEIQWNIYSLNMDAMERTLEREQTQEQEYNNLYDRRDFEALLPQTFNDITEDFIDSGHIENKINEMTPGTEMDCYTPLKEYDRKMSFDLYDNFFNFSQNEDFKRFCEHYYNEEYDIEESGTFEDNYIKENGIFDFKKFCDNTYFKSDIMDDMTLSILNSEKVCEATEKAKEIRLEQYADEIEIQTEMEQYHDDEEQTQEQDIDTFINSYDDIQATILYTNGDGNHINEIKCISDGKMLTLDVSKMNLASDTPPEKLEQITKNIIASTKAKDPIIKPEPIKQNNDFER